MSADLKSVSQSLVAVFGAISTPHSVAHRFPRGLIRHFTPLYPIKRRLSHCTLDAHRIFRGRLPMRISPPRSLRQQQLIGNGIVQGTSSTVSAQQEHAKSCNTNVWPCTTWASCLPCKFPPLKKTRKLNLRKIILQPTTYW